MNSVNAFIRTTIDDLVEKRLWPVAAGLVIALVAIPVVLSNPADQPSAPASAPVTPAVGAGGPLSAFEPAVTTDGKKSSEIRKDLEGFNSKDPFKPQNVGGGGGGSAGGSVEVQGGDAATTGGGSSDASVADTPTQGTAGGGSGDSGSSTGTSGTTTTTKTFYYTYAADVRFGKEGNLDRKTLTQFRPLPSSQDPVLVFMGVREDGQTAIFLQSAAASSTGEGNCEPDDTCTFLYMKKGDKQRLEAVNENDEVITYELVLLDIDVKRSNGPDKAKSSSRSKRSHRRAHSSRKARARHKARASRKARAKHRAQRARGFQAIGF